MIKKLLQTRDRFTPTRLWLACAFVHSGSSLLVDLSYPLSVLHFIMADNNPYFARTITLKVVKLLLESGPQINEVQHCM